MEELELRRRAAERLFDHLHRARALHLEAIGSASAVGAQGCPQVEVDRDVVSARLRVVDDPVEHGSPADEVEALVSQREQDDVSDDVPVRAARHEVLGSVAGESVEAVDREVREQPARVRALHCQVVHVVREIEEDAGLLPGSLLVAPVREFRRHPGVDVRPRRRVAEELDGVPGCGQQVFETPMAHVALPSLSGSIRRLSTISGSTARSAR